jgi:uncharacterized repeat protein (TIGR01451 family)
MLKRLAAPTILLAALTFPFASAQTARQPGAVYDFDVKDQKPAPAPAHDISGVWEPAKGVGAAIQANGAQAMPSDGKPEHDLHFTPAGEEAFKAHKPGFGTTGVATAFMNDPVDICDPQGFPRIVLHNFRASQIVQTSNQVLILYEFNKKWRVIWTDGGALPQDPEPRWWGYSVGKWVDDYTLVVQTKASASGNLVNTATVAPPAGTTDPGPGAGSATDTDTETRTADLSITKSDGVASYTAGASVTYTLVVTNAGPSDVVAAKVTDSVTALPQVLGASWTCVAAGGATCTGGPVAGDVSPQAGIYTAVVAGFLVSALGGSRTQIGGPTGAFGGRRAVRLPEIGPNVADAPVTDA